MVSFERKTDKRGCKTRHYTMLIAEKTEKTFVYCQTGKQYRTGFMMDLNPLPGEADGAVFS